MNLKNCSLTIISYLFFIVSIIHSIHGITSSVGNPANTVPGNGNGEELKRIPKQVGSNRASSISSNKDQKGSETGYGHGHGFGGGLEHHGHGHGGHYGDSKYFQYAHNPEYGHYEFGYKRGNDYHHQERYEKGHDWTFKTKVKWHDHYGGHGEHYWDYNHVDKGYGHGGGGGGGGGGGDDGYGYHSEPVPAYQQEGSASDNLETARSKTGVHKRESRKSKKFQVPKLSLDRITGQVTDESTGKTYWLQPTSTSTNVA